MQISTSSFRPISQSRKQSGSNSGEAATPAAMNARGFVSLQAIHWHLVFKQQLTPQTTINSRRQSLKKDPIKFFPVRNDRVRWGRYVVVFQVFSCTGGPSKTSLSPTPTIHTEKHTFWKSLKIFWRYHTMLASSINKGDNMCWGNSNDGGDLKYILNLNPLFNSNYNTSLKW